ncbi:hypothetical protein HHI36_018572 [Cryptolaemus montrouzieri]|uniref:Uncharacterized protein n=1 Tax=Cryptolaemus montrouzieri TaxID=559131 RepID=A0ABD2P163_9CUCU
MSQPTAPPLCMAGLLGKGAGIERTLSVAGAGLQPGFTTPDITAYGYLFADATTNAAAMRLRANKLRICQSEDLEHEDSTQISISVHVEKDADENSSSDEIKENLDDIKPNSAINTAFNLFPHVLNTNEKTVHKYHLYNFLRSIKEKWKEIHACLAYPSYPNYVGFMPLPDVLPALPPKQDMFTNSKERGYGNIYRPRYTNSKKTF